MTGRAPRTALTRSIIAMKLKHSVLPLLHRAAAALCGLALLGAAPAQANDGWWNKDWSARTQVKLDTSATGLDIKTPVVNAPIVLRLDTTKFEFAKAKPGGVDLRVVGGDDKTPLKYFIEQYDDINELAVIWVQVPRLEAGAANGALWLYYGNEKIGAAGDDPKGVHDANTVAVFDFAERDGQFKDGSSYAGAVKENGAQAQPSGWIGSAAAFSGKPVVLAAAPALKLAPGAGFSFSAWVKPAGVGERTTLYAQGGDKLGLTVALEGGQVAVGANGQRVAGGAVAAGTWQQVAVTVGDKTATVYVNGVAVASGALDLPDLQADVVIGAGYTGDLDAVQISNVARSADWMHLAGLAPAPQGKLVAIQKTDGESAEAGEGVSYFRILLANLTVDAWVVIAILLVMMAIAFLVMGFKAAMVSRVDRANRAFRAEFDKLALDVVKVDQGADGMAVASAVPVDDELRSNSPICKLYETGVRELHTRVAHNPEKFARSGISDASLEAIRSSIDAVAVRETQRLNSKMVLLTIAISGGPFLGLLGTVVGVMITFAAIAAAGDVNVNAIAPGIAAALMATVAGLGVAIPCLFGYNYLASRVKSITADMQVFGDEYLTKLAERFGA